MKKIFITFIFIIVYLGNSFAQEWSKADSVWLLNVLDGKVDLKINEDTKKAIEEGRLAVPSWMKDENGIIKNIEITKDFDDVGMLDSARINSIDPYSMPPAVFSLYVLYMDKLDSIYESGSILLSDRDKNDLLNSMPASARYRVYYNEYGGGIGGNDFNHMLSMVFSPAYRQKVKNRKNAEIYNGGLYREPTIKMSERERRQLNKAANNVNVKVSPTVRTSEFRRNGIDD